MRLVSDLDSSTVCTADQWQVIRNLTFFLPPFFFSFLSRSSDSEVQAAAAAAAVVAVIPDLCQTSEAIRVDDLRLPLDSFPDYLVICR